jgi:GTP pyrophosphokinase
MLEHLFHDYGYLHAKTERIRDWVSTPKANGYEALHATVMGPRGLGGGRWSRRMDDAKQGLPH